MPMATKRFPTGRTSDYASVVRKKIENGDLLMCAGRKWTSKLIREATGSCWSHVAFVMRIPQIDRVMVLESVESKGVRTIPLSHYLSNYEQSGKAYDGGLVIARHAELAGKATPAAMKKLGQKAVNLFGYPYDRVEISRIAVRIASAKLGFSKRYTERLKRNGEYICSEYVEECYRSIGVRITHKSGYITPGDFARDRHVGLKWILRR